MSESTRIVKLPSGREVTVKALGVAELYRVQGHLPNLTAKSAENLSTGETMKAGIKLILECVTEPRFWFDLRDDDVRLSDPLDIPKRRTELDLSLNDFWALVSALTDEMDEATKSIESLQETAKP